MMKWITYAGFVLILWTVPVTGQGIIQGSARMALTRIGNSPAAREVFADAARQSGFARSILEGLGVKVDSETAAIRQLQSLSDLERGAAISHDFRLSRKYMGSSLMQPEDRATWDLAIDSIRVNRLGEAVFKSRKTIDPFASKPLVSDPLLTCNARCRAIIADMGKHTAAGAATVPLSTLVDSLVERQKDH
jgi:hypothetical protein